MEDEEGPLGGCGMEPLWWHGTSMVAGGRRIEALAYVTHEDKVADGSRAFEHGTHFELERGELLGSVERETLCYRRLILC